MRCSRDVSGRVMDGWMDTNGDHTMCAVTSTRLERRRRSFADANGMTFRDLPSHPNLFLGQVRCTHSSVPNSHSSFFVPWASSLGGHKPVTSTVWTLVLHPIVPPRVLVVDVVSLSTCAGILLEISFLQDEVLSWLSIVRRYR